MSVDWTEHASKMHQVWPAPEWMKCMGSENGGGRVRNIRVHHCLDKVPVCNLIIQEILSAETTANTLLVWQCWLPQGSTLASLCCSHTGRSWFTSCLWSGWGEPTCAALLPHPHLPTLKRTHTWGEPTKWFCDQTKDIPSTHQMSSLFALSHIPWTFWVALRSCSCDLKAFFLDFLKTSF